MNKKTRILTVLLTVLVLAGSLVLATSADEVKESREVLPEIDRALSDRSIANSIVDYSFYDYGLSYYSIFENGISYFETVDILLSDGYFLRLTDGASRSQFEKSLPLQCEFSYEEVVYGFLTNTECLQQVEYTYTILDEAVFLSSSEDYYIIFSPYGLFVSNGSKTIVVRDYVSFRLIDIDWDNDNLIDPLYYGCSSDDFITSTTLDDYCNLLYSLDAQTTLVDWFFDTAFPVFGSVDDNIIDLGILGNYEPIRLYKFLFSLALVVAAIVLLVWLPMYGLFRLLRIKSKKR